MSQPASTPTDDPTTDGGGGRGRSDGPTRRAGLRSMAPPLRAGRSDRLGQTAARRRPTVDGIFRLKWALSTTLDSAGSWEVVAAG